MRFEFATATRIVFGPGTLSEAGALCGQFGRRALVVTGRDPRRAEPLLAALRAAKVGTVTFPTSGEPDVATVIGGVNLARAEQCDQVIAFGGGSALDAGKAMAAMLVNPGDLFDYLEIIGRGQALTVPSAPFTAIPTTAGTGAEVTRNAVLASPQHGVKVSLRSALMLPRLALVDPELAHDLPPAITASTGLDALTQLIEPFVCSRPNPVTDALCAEGLLRAARSLQVAVSDGRNAAAREDMAIASLFGGLALANAGLGAVHGFAGPIGGRFPAPHGAICAILLPQVMTENLAALRERQPQSLSVGRYEHAAQFLTGRATATADDGVEWVRNVVAEQQIPRLRSYGITSEHFAELILKSSQASSMRANPIVLNEKELWRILERAW